MFSINTVVVGAFISCANLQAEYAMECPVLQETAIYEVLQAMEAPKVSSTIVGQKNEYYADLASFTVQEEVTEEVETEEVEITSETGNTLVSLEFQDVTEYLEEVSCEFGDSTDLLVKETDTLDLTKADVIESTWADLVLTTITFVTPLIGMIMFW